MRKAKNLKRNRHGDKRSTRGDTESHEKDERDEDNHDATGDVPAE